MLLLPSAAGAQAAPQATPPANIITNASIIESTIKARAAADIGNEIKKADDASLKVDASVRGLTALHAARVDHSVLRALIEKTTPPIENQTLIILKNAGATDQDIASLVQGTAAEKAHLNATPEGLRELQAAGLQRMVLQRIFLSWRPWARV